MISVLKYYVYKFIKLHLALNKTQFGGTASEAKLRLFVEYPPALFFRYVEMGVNVSIFYFFYFIFVLVKGDDS
jgi:hypothetical protein